MRKYILKSTKLTGSLTFGFNELNRLVLYENTCNMDERQLDWTLANLPHASEWLSTFKGNGITITEVPEDLTFERFWNAYDKKINRKRAEPLFEKFTAAEKMQAIMRIKAYQEYCAWKHRGIADPEKYIKERYFETDWTKLK